MGISWYPIDTSSVPLYPSSPLNPLSTNALFSQMLAAPTNPDSGVIYAPPVTLAAGGTDNTTTYANEFFKHLVTPSSNGSSDPGNQLDLVALAQSSTEPSTVALNFLSAFINGSYTTADVPYPSTPTTSFSTPTNGVDLSITGALGGGNASAYMVQLVASIVDDYNSSLTSAGITLPADSTAEALAAFGSFLQTQVTRANFPVPDTSSGTSLMMTFFNNWHQYMGSTAGTYQQVYNFYLPGDDQAGTQYHAAINAFYAQQVAANGYFIPGQSFPIWDAALKDASNSSQIGQNGGNPFGIGVNAPLTDSYHYKTIILNQIYALIAAMIQSTQEVAAVQASRLTLLTQWQQAYSNSLAEIPTFTRIDVNAGGSGASQSDWDTARGSLNSVTNATFRNLLQTDQGIVGDAAKGLQSNINQSNDAVSQQASMATSIIQELQSILGVIFH